MRQSDEDEVLGGDGAEMMESLMIDHHQRINSHPPAEATAIAIQVIKKP